MSVEALVWAWQQDLPLGPKATLVALADFADGDNVCWPGQVKLAFKIGAKERALRGYIRTLEELGLITISERRRVDGSRTSNLDQLGMPETTSTVRGSTGRTSQPAESAGSAAGINRQISSHQPAESAGHELPEELPEELTTLVGFADAERAEEAKSEERIEQQVQKLWNDGCGDLIKARVVSASALKLIRAAEKRHGRAEFIDLFTRGLAVVRHDPHWLGTRAKKPTREAPPFGLVNYLRHFEDKANIAPDTTELPSFSDVPVGSHWYTHRDCSVRILSLNGVTAVGIVTRPYDKPGAPALGERITLQRADLKAARAVPSERTPF